MYDCITITEFNVIVFFLLLHKCNKWLGLFLHTEWHTMVYWRYFLLFLPIYRMFFFSSYFLFCVFAFLIFELLFDCRLPVCLVAMHCDKWTLCYFTLAVYIYMGCLVRFFFILICFCCLQPNASKASSQSNAIVFDTVL